MDKMICTYQKNFAFYFEFKLFSAIVPLILIKKYDLVKFSQSIFLKFYSSLKY